MRLSSLPIPLVLLLAVLASACGDPDTPAVEQTTVPATTTSDAPPPSTATTMTTTIGTTTTAAPTTTAGSRPGDRSPSGAA